MKFILILVLILTIFLILILNKKELFNNFNNEFDESIYKNLSKKDQQKWPNKYYFHNKPVCQLCVSENIRPADKKVYCVWTGNNNMSKNRKLAYESLKKNIGVEVVLINKDNLNRYIKSDYPLHEAYQYLSETCKSDYLRCYLMHFYGGCYHDIKHVNTNFNKYFDNLNNSNKWINAPNTPYNTIISNNKKRTMSLSPYTFKKNICTSTYIFKQETPITHEWFLLLHQILDTKLNDLKQNPSKDVRDFTGKKLSDNTISKYPIYWNELNAGILGDIIWKYRDKVLYELPFPNFNNYI